MKRNGVICPPCIVKLLLPQAEASIPAPRAAEGMPAEQDLLQGVLERMYLRWETIRRDGA